MQDLGGIVERALADFAAAPDPATLENAKARYLGKSGELSGFRPQGSPEERRAAGVAFNTAKQTIEAALEARRAALAERSEEHTSELQSQSNLVCRLLLEEKKHS